MLIQLAMPLVLPLLLELLLLSNIILGLFLLQLVGLLLLLGVAVTRL